MRVLLLTHRLPYPPNRGDRIRAYHLIRILARSAHVDVLALVHNAEERRDAVNLSRFAERVETAMVPRTKNLIRAALALPGPTALTHILLDSPEVDRGLERLMTPTPPDVVLAYCSGMARYALHPPLARIPFVLDLVDLDSAKWATLSERARWPMRLIYRREANRLRRFEVAATTRSVATTVVNDRERVAILSINPGANVHIVSNGVDAAAFTPDGPSASANVVFSGVFNYEPNEFGALWLAKEVWPRVRQRRTDATLTLVGMNPTRRVRELASDPSIAVTGTVPDVRPHLRRAAAAVAPLFMASGIQNKVLEAVAAGLPCVVTPRVMQGLPEVVRPACVAASTAEAFADAIVEVLRLTPAERAGRAGKARLDDLSWEAQLAPMAALLESAIAPTDNPRPARDRLELLS